MLGTVSYAQQYYVFADKDGQVIENGATIVCTEAEGDEELVMMRSGLCVKNVAAPSNYQVAVVATIRRIDNGALQLCFPTYCHSYAMPGTYGGDSKTSLEQGALKDIMSEWLPEGPGECVVEYTARNYQGAFPKGDYTVTVHYQYSAPAAITSVGAGEDSSATGFYDLGGRRVGASHRGITIGNGKNKRIKE